MKHLLVDVYPVCSNKSSRIKIGPAPGVIDFPYMFKVKKFSCKKLKQLALRYLA
jgi:hypothetical protein